MLQLKILFVRVRASFLKYTTQHNEFSVESAISPQVEKEIERAINRLLVPKLNERKQKYLSMTL